MSISVRTLETGEVPDRCLEPQESMIQRYRGTYGGSLKQWVEEVRGESCRCSTPNCDGIDEIGYGDSVIMVDIRYPKNLFEKAQAAYQDFRGIDRNIHGVSDETAAMALHDADGNRASAYFTCDHCHYQYGHHREGQRWVLDGDAGGNPVYSRCERGTPTTVTL